MDLIDPFGRTIRDLRISVTDRCNFRCTYCMPEEGMQWLPRSEVLTFEEIERVARIFVERFDVDGIRLTGGEPTMRAHITLLVRKLAALGVDVAMTTNGATFRNLAHDLRDAGLRRVNISLDTLRRDRFEQMTRRDELDHVLDGVAGLGDGGGEGVHADRSAAVVLDQGAQEAAVQPVQPRLVDLQPRQAARGDDPVDL